MSAAVSEKLYTVEEFLELDLPDDEEYELIEGRIVARPKGGTSGEHGEIVFKLSAFLGNYLLTNPIGKGYTEGSCTLGRPEGSSYVKPDVCFVANGRTPTKFSGPIPVAPDLTVEVWSLSDDTKTIQDKIEAYQESGVRLVWSVYILQKYVIVYRLGEAKRTLLDLDDTLSDEEMLPGFKLEVNRLFG